MARIVLNTFGSFGDVHPYLAMALELQRRGHECIIATAEVYRQKITAEGLGFAQVRPDVGELLSQPELIAKLWHPRSGSIYLLRDYLLPRVEQSFSDLDRACGGADFLITHAVGYAGPIVAALRRLPWLSVVLQPTIFFSACDPPVIASAPSLRHLYPLGGWLFKSLARLIEKRTRLWAQPVFALRSRLGLQDASNPVVEGQFSPYGTLTLFSNNFARHQPDWPPNSRPTGFVFYDKRGEGFGLPTESNVDMSQSLRKFLADGPPPLLFTLGSSAVTHPGTFYEESAEAASKLDMRAVLLVGRQAVRGNEQIHVEEYASYSALMPHVSCVIHQGGIGTVAQTLRAGKPMLVVPWAHDQPDNAYRLEKLSAARVIARRRYTSSRAAAHLRELLKTDARYSRRAQQLASQIVREDGLNAACNRIEGLLKS